jgi:DNA replication protein DnaC
VLFRSLLIIDDLGTEMTTSFTVSALYEIINTRLLEGRRTVIHSNLTMDQMRARYSPQILSRLEGEYRRLTFYGDDIRLKKNAR